MKKINIAPHIKELMVFDDSEYCQNKDNTVFCQWIGSLDEEGICRLFNEYVDSDEIYEKCKKCKDYWNKANLMRGNK